MAAPTMRSPRTDFGPNAWFVDELYGRFVVDPASVPEEWRAFFEGRVAPADGDSLSEGTDPPKAGNGSAAAATAPTSAPTGNGDGPGPTPETTPANATPLRGAAAVIARRMDESLAVPTATSVRQVPAKLLELNRRLINRHRERGQGDRVSFTHLIGFAVARAMRELPAMRRSYAEVDGRPSVIVHDHVGLGLAVDVQRKDGSRTLLVPVIRDADTLDFAAFVAAYEQLIGKVRGGSLSPDDFTGASATLTNPGTIGTSSSVPRLMSGQAAIVGVGAIAHDAAFEGADSATLAELGVSKTVTLTNTYDHRVIQGAESGEFLARVHDLLLGADNFYGEAFRALDLPYRPIHWTRDERPSDDSLDAREKQARVLQFINNYRVRGHLIADLDPLSSAPPPTHPELDPANLGFTIWDLDRPFVTGGFGGTREATLGEIWDRLRDAYTGTLAIEYMHIQDPEQKAWLQAQIEVDPDVFTEDDRRRILTELNRAEAFERFLHQRYVGHKRFSLEGAESLIPLVREVLDRAADDGLHEAVIGMSHRGRLNVLANVLGKSYGRIFHEFEGDVDPDSVEGSGDVKYHLGATGMHRSGSGASIELTLASNPSHLESVDPVVEGMARAKSDLLGEADGAPVLPVLIHGEAAFAGQGVVAETLNLSQLAGYRTGGSIHVIVNNQLGFTTPPEHGRSSVYASDVARTVQAPIFHVNGDDPEACVRATRLAYAFRQAFARDVVIDLWCYRRWGHNETDEPAFTQPLMYRTIADLPSVRTRYTERLVARGELSQEDAEAALRDFAERLQQAFDETHDDPSSEGGVPDVERRSPAAAETPQEIDTAVPRERLDELADALTDVPRDFEVHPKLEKWLAERRTQLERDAVDWAFAEALAFGSLAADGVSIRLTGQDTRRGTFSQRHAALVDQRTGAEHMPLQTVADGSALVWIYDSLLSEFAAMGFEYGYSVANPDMLVLWEAQFGDFVNGGQIVIDQFLVAAEDKWSQRSGLVLLLPHGYEGQGPEHSSARLERFLTLAAEDNLEVVVPSTAAQYFHLLRRHAMRDVKKPLVVATPKSFLRTRGAMSTAAELAEGRFEPVLADPDPPSDPSRIVLCHGKLFHDLAATRAERHADVMLVRLERCYPFPVDEFRAALDGIGDRDVVWAQEEPENMGAGRFAERNLRERLAIAARIVARPESASPATGSLTLHKREQQALIDRIVSGAR